MVGATEQGVNRVALIGGVARRALRASTDAQVLAVFARSFYLEISSEVSDSETLVCIGDTGLGPGPINLLCNLQSDASRYFNDLRPGTDASYRGDTLSVGSREFSLTGAAVWSAPRPIRNPDTERLCRGLKQIASRPGRGLARLIPLFLDRQRPPRFENNPVLQRVWQAGSALRNWLENNPDETPPPQSEGLLGLGDGLTPAGDDLLIGMMLALRIYGRAEVADRLATWALPLARTRTNKISVSHLTCAAAGEGSAVLHDTLCALNHANFTALDHCLDALDHVGHTSGWDALTGVALATDSVAQYSTRVPPLAH